MNRLDLEHHRRLLQNIVSDYQQTYNPTAEHTLLYVQTIPALLQIDKEISKLIDLDYKLGIILDDRGIE